jgi:serine/threonine protein kinase
LLKLEGQKWIPKICDFGFSKLINNNNADTCVGTPAYEAPELWRPMYGKIKGNFFFITFF